MSVRDVPVADKMAAITCQNMPCPEDVDTNTPQTTTTEGSGCRKLENSALAIVTIQKHARRFILRTRFLRLRRAVIRLQAVIRGVLLRVRLRRWHRSAKTIQRRYRGYKRTRQEHVKFLNTKKAVILIQREWREWKRRQGVEYNW